MGPAVCFRKAARGPLQLLRPGSEAILSGGSGAGRHVPCGRDDLRRLHPRIPRCGLAPFRAVLRRRGWRRRGSRPVLPRLVRAARQARRCVDGRCYQSPPSRHPHTASRCLPHLQFLGAGRRQARALHARRSDHAVSRVRARPAPAADARRRSRRIRPRGRRMGRGRAAQPVHGELLLGMGRRSST